MKTTLAAAAVVLATAAACGTAGPDAARGHAPAHVEAGATVQPAAYADHAVFRASGRRVARAERHEEMVEQRERLWARSRRLQRLADSCPAVPSVHFDTPDAAMAYLTDAWNSHDLASLCAVTTPDARFQLLQMHYEAVNLRLDTCTDAGNGEWTCHFFHDYPRRLHEKGHGETYVIAAPATKQGWYLSDFVGCG